MDIMTKKELTGGVVHAMPKDLRKALTSTPAALAVWEDITPLARNEWICWVISAKQEETRERRIKVGIDKLLSGMHRPCCWVGCIHRTDKKPSTWQQNVLIDKKPKIK